MLKQGRIVALDKTEDLLRLHSGRSVKLRLGSALPQQLEPLVAERCDDGAIRLALPEYAEVERVMAALREAGVAVQEMEIMRPDLEEVFVQIMRGA
jgi:ABC-2 type transport system ATP-binding protein